MGSTGATETDEDFLAEIRGDFFEEAKDILEQLSSALLTFEQEGPQSAVMSELLRLLHTLKGSSKAVEFHHFGSFAHSVEDFFIGLRDGKIAFAESTPALIWQLYDTFESQLGALAEQDDAPSSYEAALAQLHKSTEQQGDLHFREGDPPRPDADAGSGEQEGMSDEQAMALLAEMDEGMGSATDSKTSGKDESMGKEHNQAGPDGPQETPNGPEAKADANASAKAPTKAPTKTDAKASPPSDESIKIKLSKVDGLIDYFGEQNILQQRLQYLLDNQGNPALIKATMRSLQKVTSDLQQTVIGLRLVSVGPIFKRLERIARDTARATGKKLNFQTRGEESELDKKIVDGLLDPLMHMVRNAIDHGLEGQQEREEKGKDTAGTLTLTAEKKGNLFFIHISDDGRGLDKTKLWEKAVKKGLVNEHEHMEDAEIFELVFHNGFSTKDQASDISGRGVGMDVVQEMISSMRGKCSIWSEKEKGTCFSIQLPMSLSMFNGTVVDIAGHRYVMPNSEFSQLIDLQQGDLEALEDGRVYFKKDEVFYEAISLRRELHGTRSESQEKVGHVAAIIPHGAKSYALVVDDVLEQQRIMGKNIPVDVASMDGISGGTILSDGKVALILGPSQIVDKKAG